MDQYFLVEAGFPYYQLISANDAAELFESVGPFRRHGSLGDGFEYWDALVNGLGRRVCFTVTVSPVSADELSAVCERLSPFVILPKGFVP